jgi:hypothetical protein
LVACGTFLIAQDIYYDASRRSLLINVCTHVVLAVLLLDEISFILLEKNKLIFAVGWGHKSSEHFFTYSDEGMRHVVFYPKLMSLSVRTVIISDIPWTP